MIYVLFWCICHEMIYALRPESFCALKSPPGKFWLFRSLPTSSHLGIDLECVCYDNPSVTVHNSKLERLHTVVYKIQTLCIALQCDTVSNAVCLTKKMQCNDDSTVKLKWGCSQLFGNFVSLATTFLIFQCSGQWQIWEGQNCKLSRGQKLSNRRRTSLFGQVTSGDCFSIAT